MLEIGIFRLLDLERTLIYQKKNYEKVQFFTQLSYHLMQKLLKSSLMLSSVYFIQNSKKLCKILEIL